MSFTNTVKTHSLSNLSMQQEQLHSLTFAAFFLRLLPPDVHHNTATQWLPRWKWVIQKNGEGVKDAGEVRKQILHWSKEKTHSLSDNIWWEGGTGIGEQMRFVAGESRGIE